MMILTASANKRCADHHSGKVNSAPNSAELKADPDIAAKITEAKEGSAKYCCRTE